MVYPDSEGFRLYGAPGWRAAARKIKNNTRIPKETGYNKGKDARYRKALGFLKDGKTAEVAGIHRHDRPIAYRDLAP
jgi:hypothetical protein